MHKELHIALGGASAVVIHVVQQSPRGTSRCCHLPSGGRQKAGAVAKILCFKEWKQQVQTRGGSIVYQKTTCTSLKEFHTALALLTPRPLLDHVSHWHVFPLGLFVSSHFKTAFWYQLDATIGARRPQCSTFHFMLSPACDSVNR